jgi:phosphatidylserine/phosphatidylglycerophosphate/cardiolipin synthase-like enzyme
MIALSSTDEMLTAMSHAKHIALTAYTLPTGRVLDGLINAAKQGADVHVRLEGLIYHDNGTVANANHEAAAQLNDAGAKADFYHSDPADGKAMLHMKSAIVDNEVFLDDRNWPDDGRDTILRDTFPADIALVRGAQDGQTPWGNGLFAVGKRDALYVESRVLENAKAGDDVIVETESFGASYPYSKLEQDAVAGAHVRVLVNARDLKGSAKEAKSIERLMKNGAEVRLCDDDEKFAVVNGSRGYVGSANLSAVYKGPDQIDWGLRTDDRDILAHVSCVFDQRWKSARAFASVDASTAATSRPKTSATFAAV